MKHWALSEMKGINLGDNRLNQRAAKILFSLGNKPTASIPLACEGWHETKAAYRFFDNPRVTSKAILAPHKDATIERITNQPRVLMLQDTSELDYSNQKQKRGIGPGNYEGHNVLFIHPTIAVTPEKVCLGVYDDYQWCREELHRKKYSKREMGTKTIQTHINKKENYRWLLGYHKATEVAQLCPNTHVIMVADREADIFDIYDDAEYREGKKADWLIRIKSVKRALINTLGERDSALLQERMLTIKPKKRIKFMLPKRNGLGRREVNQTLRVARLKLHPPTGRRGNLRLRPVVVTVLLAQEESPPKGVEPINWWLMTNIKLDNNITPQVLISWYLCRWQIEVFFRILKSGCQIEKLQLTEAKRFKPCFAIYLIIAWRILFLTSLASIEPSIACTVALTEEEWRTAYMVALRKTPPKKPPPLLTIITIIAQLGGYLNRRHDPKPGPKALWQGIMRLYDLINFSNIKNTIAKSYG
jgi:hypothetical protein